MDNVTNLSCNKALNVADNNVLYRRLIAGDASARDEMIEGNTGLVVFRVDAYLRTSPQMTYYRDDMISEGLVGLCRAVDDMRARGMVKNPKPTGYITKVIDRHIAHVVDERDTIVVPHRTQRLARAEGKPVETPRVVSERALIGKVAPIPFSDGTVIELHEELMASCQDALDRTIIAMRSEGFTHDQIAERCLMSKSGITRRIKAIGKRLVERCPEYRWYVCRGKEDD